MATTKTRTVEFSFEDLINFLLSDTSNQTINHISPLTVNTRKLRANSSSVIATVLNFTVHIFVFSLS